MSYYFFKTCVHLLGLHPFSLIIRNEHEVKSKVGPSQKGENHGFGSLLYPATIVIVKNYLGIVWGHPTRRLETKSSYFFMKKFSRS